VDGAVVTVCAIAAAFLATGLAGAVDAFTVGLAEAAGRDDEDDRPHAVAVPMTNTSPQNARSPVRALCLAGGRDPPIRRP
jgi:hypothetical protein